MKNWTRSLLSLALLTTVACSTWAQSDPQQVLKEIQAARTKAVNDARASGSLDVDALNKLVQEKATAAIAGMDPATIPAKDAYAWAEVFSLAGKHKETCDLCAKFLTTNPDPQRTFDAKMLMLSSCNALEEGHMLTMMVPTVEPPTPMASQQFLSSVVYEFTETVAKQMSVDEALKMLASAERNMKYEDPEAFAKRMVEAQLKRTPDGDAEKLKAQYLATAKTQRGSLEFAIAERRAELLADAGRKDESKAILEAFVAKTDPSDASYRRAKGSLTRMSMVGAPAPALTPERGYGKFEGLESLKGKVVLLDFFAHWCGPCINSFPDMKQLYTDLKPKGLEIVGFTTYYGYYKTERNLEKDAEYAKMKDFIADHQLPWPVVYGERTNFDAYGVTGIPHVTVIGRDGTVHSVKIGYSPATFKKFREEIEKLLG